MFSNAVRIFTLRGFDIKLDPSWLLIAALITWSLSQNLFPQSLPGQSGRVYLVMALMAMLCFFASLLAHELAHAVVARRFGLQISGITLFVFGGIAELEQEPDTPGKEFWIALAGPAMSLVLAGCFWMLEGLAYVSGSGAPLRQIASYLAAVNLVLALFNIVPAFPLDGGRVLRAQLWNRHGDLLKATKLAHQTGRAFAFGLIALGAFVMLSGQALMGLWQILIGLFLHTAATGAYRNAVLRDAFAGKTLSMLMSRSPKTTSPDATLDNLVEDIMLPFRISFVPVTEDDLLLGYVDGDVLHGIDRENWASTKVGDVFVALDASNRVGRDMPLDDLLRHIGATGCRKFLVTDGAHLEGVITLADLTEYLGIFEELHLR